MWQRFTREDGRVIGSHIGILVQLLAAALCVPIAVGAASGEWEPVSRYFSVAGLALVLGTALRFLGIKPARLLRRQAIAVVGLAWIVLAAIGAIPLFFSGHFGDYLDALFESVSGFTTTGVSIAQDLEHLSNADNAWRFMMQLIGGLGLIVVALSLGLFGRRIDASLYSSEGRYEHVVPNIAGTARFLAGATIAVIVAGGLAAGLVCLTTGMSPDRAALHGIWLSIASFATGGFSPMSASVMYYHSFALEVVLMLLMLLGSLNFALFLEARRGRTNVLARDSELRTLAVWIIAMTAAFTAAACATPALSDTSALLRQGLFTIVSAFTTTGLQSMTTMQITSVLPSGALLVLVLLTAVGGCAGSTSGGIKMARLSVIAKSVMATIKSALSPESARINVEYYHLGSRPLNAEVVKEAMTVFILFAASCTFGAVVGVAHGIDAIQAISDSVVISCNGGLPAGSVTTNMPTGLELVYIVQMWAGRLEFVTLAALGIELFISLKPRRSIEAGERTAVRIASLFRRNQEGR